MQPAKIYSTSAAATSSWPAAAAASTSPLPTRLRSAARTSPSPAARPNVWPAAVEQLRRHGGEVQGHSADVREYDAIEAALAAAREGFGPIDVLVSGAAGNFVAPALGMSSKGFRTVIDIDLVGSFNVLRAGHALPAPPGRLGHQHLGAAGLQPHALPGPRVRGQGRHRHAHPRAGHGMGARRRARQFHRARPHRRHRRHTPAGATSERR